LLKRISARVFYIMGNDDNVALDYEDEQILPLHGRQLCCGNFSFVGYQFTPPFVGAVFVKPESEIESDVRSLEPLLDRRTVLVTHAPACGTLDQSFNGEHVGSPSLAALLERSPVLAHIHGHIHSCFGRDGSHFNVAAAGRRRAFLIDLPKLDHTELEGE
jgi:Icc-related predicted phosphoesterase